MDDGDFGQIRDHRDLMFLMCKVLWDHMGTVVVNTLGKCLPGCHCCLCVECGPPGV